MQYSYTNHQRGKEKKTHENRKITCPQCNVFLPQGNRKQVILIESGGETEGILE